MASIISQTASSSFADSPIIVNAQATSLLTSSSLKLVCDLYVWSGSSASQPASPSFILKKFPIGSDKKCVFDFSPIISSYMTASLPQSYIDSGSSSNTQWFTYEIYEEAKNSSGLTITSSHQIPTAKPFIATDGYFKWGEKIDLAGSASIGNITYEDNENYPLLSSAPQVQTINNTEVPFYFTLYSRGEGGFSNVDGLYYIDADAAGFVPYPKSTTQSGDIKFTQSFSRTFLKGREALGITSFQYAPYSGSVLLSTLKTVNIECQKKYEPIRIIWKNRYGGIDQFEFALVSRKSMLTENKTYNQNALSSTNGTYSPFAGTTIYNSDEYQSLLVNTDYISEDNNKLFEELLASDEIYLVESLWDETGNIPFGNEAYFDYGAVLTSLLLESKNITFKTSAVDKLVQYTLEFKYATPYKLKL